MKNLILFMLIAVPFHALGNDCKALAEKYRKELSLPYKDFTDLELRRCLDLTPVNATNMHAFVAAAFYDNSLKVRQSALTKLEAYNCKNDGTCDELANILDGQIKATTQSQSSTILMRATYLHKRIALTQTPEPKKILCETQAIAAAKALANQNGSASKEAKSSVSSDGTQFDITLTEDEVGTDTYDVLTSGGHLCLVYSVQLKGRSPSRRP